MKKKALIVLLTALLFLSAAALGVSTVFRVDTVTLRAEVSAANQPKAVQMQKELLALYQRDSIFTSKRAQAEKLVEKYPDFRLTGFVKSYPNKLVISVVEGVETYEVESASGNRYALGADGIVLKILSPEEVGAEGNVLLKGVQVRGEVGGTLFGDDCFDSLLALSKGLDKKLGGIRKNVLSVEVLYRSPEIVYLIRMREGVTVRVDTPSERTVEKANAAMDKYLSLSDAQRMRGSILVGTNAEGIFAEYVD